MTSLRTVAAAPTHLTGGDETADPAALVEWLRTNGAGHVDLFVPFRTGPARRVEGRRPLPDAQPPAAPPAAPPG